MDIMSYRSTIPFALNLDYRPRPSFQSYGTWNGFLAKANNKFLMSTRGPELMLLEISPIDSRLATEEDPDVFLTLLQRFEVRDAQAGLLVLQRKGQFHPRAGRALGSQMVRFGEWIDLPSTTARDLLWIQADIKPTLLGWLVGISWRFPVLGLDLQYPDGHLAHFRLIPELLRNGFIISPTVTNIKEYVAASNGSSDVAQARPTQIRCTGNRFVNLVYNENTAFGFTAYAIGGTSNFP